MKRTLLVCLALCLLVSAAYSAPQNSLKGTSWLSGDFGYAFGMGDAFLDYTDPITNIKLTSGPDYAFSGQYYYGINDKWMIGGEVLFQRYTVSINTPANLALSLPATEISESQTEANFIVNAMYQLSQSKKSDWFLTGGTGFYDFGGSEIGFNSGILWRTQVSDNVHLYGTPRLHIVMADETPMMFQLTMGVHWSL